MLDVTHKPSESLEGPAGRNLSATPALRIHAKVPACTGFTESGGFALLELSTAMFVLAVGISGVLVSFHHGLEKVRVIHESHIAIRAIENELETLRALPFDELDSGAFRSDTPESARLLNAKRSVIVEAHREFPDTLKQVQVEVVWTGDNGRRIAKSVTTLMRNTP